ncbi:MAG TPA: hypothetical protein DIC51_03285 [Coxiellaceae bacterium]|nr:hypothetical protein [Coxiellaceae bacterium]
MRMLKSNESAKMTMNDEFSESTVQESIRSCLELIEALAEQYTYKNIVTREELIMIGKSALTRASDHFCMEQGLSFYTYATWWIKQSIESKLWLKYH